MRGAKVALATIEGGLSRLPVAPAWLPDGAKAEWRRVAAELRKRRTITSADLTTLETYCLAIGTVRRMQAAISSEGDTVVTARGETRRHPAFQTLFQALTESRRLAAELGLTPASRNKAPASENPDDDLSDLDL